MTTRTMAPTRKDYLPEIQKQGDGSILFIANTGQPDRMGEAIPPGAWKALGTYHANPIVLFGHEARSLPIGTARAQVTRDGLMARVSFAGADENPLAPQVERSVLAGLIRGMSVGFNPDQAPRMDARGVLVYPPNSCELLELSIVTIPADSGALALLGKAFLAGAGRASEEEDAVLVLRDEPGEELIRLVLPDPPAVLTPARVRHALGTERPGDDEVVRFEPEALGELVGTAVRRALAEIEYRMGGRLS
jgi:HK97 family phage prohead protease